MLIIISIFLYTMGIYFSIGILFALYFVIKGASRLDPDVKGTRLIFRLLIFPGTVALWLPLLLKLRKTPSRLR